MNEMNFYDFLDEVNIGLFGKFAIANEFKIFRDLPEIPLNYKLPIINSNKEVFDILEDLKKENKAIDKKYPNTDENLSFSFTLTDYESECFLLMLKFSSVFCYWFGNHTPQHNYYEDQEIVISFELLVDVFWRYIQEECTLDYLRKVSQQFYEKYISKVVS